MTIIIFEDENWGNLRPISLTRPVWDLRCGILRLGEKIKLRCGKEINGYICRDYLVPLVEKRHPNCEINHLPEGETLFLNGRALFERFDEFFELKEDACFFSKGELVAALVKNSRFIDNNSMNAENITGALSSLPRTEVDVKTVKYPWEIVAENPNQIEADLKNLDVLIVAYPEDYLSQGVHITPGAGLFLEGDVSLAPGVVIDTSEGPVFLGDGVRVMPNAVIMGPAAVGTGSVVKIGAKIYPGTSIGPFCKVGGEIETTVIQGYSNKQHEGFLGHAYVGQWCNFGAGTENSNLKNNYKPVKVQIGKRRVNTGELFIGLFMGDHSKTGINTTFNTGSVVEVASMAYGGGFQPRFIPSFHWSDGEAMKPANFEETIKTAKTVLARRKVELLNEEIAVLKHIYDEAVT